MSLGMRAGSEFVSAIVVGAGIGWALDRGLGTNPAFLIVFFFIGVAAGVWNVIRLTSPKDGGQGHDSRLSSAEAADKGLRRSAPEQNRRPGGASSGRAAGPEGRTTTRIRRSGDRSGTGDPSDRAILDSSARPDPHRGHDVSLTNSGLFMLLAVALVCLMTAIARAGRLGGAEPDAGARRNGLRIHRRHGPVGRRRRRNAVLPVRLQHLLLHSDLQPSGLHPLCLHGDEPDRHHRRPRAARLPHRRDHRDQGARGRAFSACSFPRACRSTSCHWW